MDKERPVEKKYFDVLSKGYFRAAKIFFIAMAVCFVVTLFFNSSLLTYNNFSYFARDLNSAADLASGSYSSISYKNDEMRRTKNFRGGVITVSSTDLTIYTATGGRTLALNESFVSPEIVTSQKYAVVYDLGGNKYSVYNSFARLSSGSYTHPISGASASDSGWFALVTKDDSHTSVVNLYDGDCDHRNTYSFSSRYVFSTAINQKGSRIAILLTEAAGDKFSTSVMICEPGKGDKRAEVRFSDGLPMGCCFTDNGDLLAVCTDGMFLLDENDGTVKASHSFEDKEINRVSLTSEGAAIAVSENESVARNRITVFDKNGEMVYSTVIEGGMIDMEYYDGYVFVNQSTAVTKINVKRGNSSSIKTADSGTDIIVYDSGNILLCYRTKAIYISI